MLAGPAFSGAERYRSGRNELDSKSSCPRDGARGFESHPLRHQCCQASPARSNPLRGLTFFCLTFRSSRASSRWFGSALAAFLAARGSGRCRAASGREKSSAPERNGRVLEAFLLPLVIVPFDMAAAQAYGAIRASLERRGQPIGGMDMLIAASALARKCTLVTHNLREFARVEGLVCETWVQA